MAKKKDLNETNDLAALLIRSLAAAGSNSAVAVGDPVVAGVGVGVGALLGLVAHLVEKVGRKKAEQILAELVGDPAKPLTDADLDANVTRVRAELGI